MKTAKGITKIVLSPLRGIKEIKDDMSGKYSDDDEGLSQALCISTLGASSLIKGTAKSIWSGLEDIFDD